MRHLPLRSPPRMRGKVWLHQKPGRVPGITPAYAGKSQRTAFPVAGGQDHPRVCGEKCPNCGRKMKQQGSPPRVRGKVAIAMYTSNKTGITPACAGKRYTFTIDSPPFWDHPRVCGEKWLRKSPDRPRPGSPPRVRGKALAVSAHAFECGITPACAGKRIRIFRPIG